MPEKSKTKSSLIILVVAIGIQLLLNFQAIVQADEATVSSGWRPTQRRLHDPG